ncbi:TPA: hypothetical protein ACUKXA_004955, partial [Escherichia coli]
FRLFRPVHRVPELITDSKALREELETML